MRIARIAVSNHRRVADLDLDVRGHVVFVGPNATGKSTILRLLDLVLGASWTQIGASLDVGQLRDTTVPLIVEVQLDELDADDLAHFADKVEVGTGEASGTHWLTARLSAVASAIDADRLEFTRSWVKPLVEDMSLTRDDIAQVGWTLLPANRSPDRELGSGRSSAVKSLLRAVSLEAGEAQAIENALGDLTEALATAGSLSTIREDLAAELSSLFPTPVDKDEIVIDLPSTTASNPLGDVDVGIDRGSGRSSLAEQSDGLRSLAVVAVQLLARRSARILAIDEPEIHLHPRGQANLARLLASAPGQRVAATHSPAVLAQFAPTDAVALMAGGAPSTAVR